MFARETSKKTNAPAEAKCCPTNTALARKGVTALNPVWQSLALRTSAIQAAPGVGRLVQRQPAPAPQPAQPAQASQPATQAPTSRAALIKAKKLDNQQNVNDLAGILYHETRGELGVDMKVAIGWIVLNRMLILDRTTVSSLIGGNQLLSLAGAPTKLKILAQMLLSGQYEDTTNGSFFYFTPKIMPDSANKGCCSGETGPCERKRFEKGVDCSGKLQTVPGSNPQQQRFFPSFARPSKRQAQPSGTDPMLIQVYQR